MSNYVKLVDYAAKDLLLHGDPAKAIKGTEVGAEFDAIATMSATKVDSGGALGTPSSGTLTNCTGLPISTGVSGLGTGVATALAVNVGSAGSAVLNGGVLGTPSSGTLTNCSGLPAAGLVASTTQSVGFGSIELGHASDTTISRTGAGAIAVEGVAVLLSGGALGTPSSGNLGSCTAYPSSALAGVPITAAATGFTATGGTTPKTLTVDVDVTASTLSTTGTDPSDSPTYAELGRQAFVDYNNTPIAVGGGITTGSGTYCNADSATDESIKTIRILIDLTGLNSGGAAGDIIGVNGTSLPCYIATLPAITVLGGRMTCLETPAGSDTDIDLYSATEGTGVEDDAIAGLTETQIINAGAQAAGTVTYFSADPPPNSYLYLVNQGTAGTTYTAGRFLIEVFGV